MDFTTKQNRLVFRNPESKGPLPPSGPPKTLTTAEKEMLDRRESAIQDLSDEEIKVYDERTRKIGERLGQSSLSEENKDIVTAKCGDIATKMDEALANSQGQGAAASLYVIRTAIHELGNMEKGIGWLEEQERVANEGLASLDEALGYLKSATVEYKKFQTSESDNGYFLSYMFKNMDTAWGLIQDAKHNFDWLKHAPKNITNKCERKIKTIKRVLDAAVRVTEYDPSESKIGYMGYGGF